MTNKTAIELLEKMTAEPEDGNEARLDADELDAVLLAINALKVFCWHTETPDKQDEYYISLDYHYKIAGIERQGSFVSIAEYDLSGGKWVLDDYIRPFMHAKVRAWAELPAPYDKTKGV